MSQPLRAMIIEDSENDATLIELELRRGGYEPRCVRVQTEESMREALRGQEWDVVIADYVLPQFNGLAALEVVRELGLDLPFIVVSGHITDDTAVAAMKAGANDYLMKDNLRRLPAVVQRELREAEVRRERRRTEDQLKLESAFRQAVEASIPAGIAAADLAGTQTYVNRAFCAMVGWTEAELVGGKAPYVYWPPEDTNAMFEGLRRAVEGVTPPGGLELRFRRRNEERFHVLVQVTPLLEDGGSAAGWVCSVSDITARKQAESRLAAEHAITRILATARGLDEAAPGIVQVLMDALEVEVGVLWLLDSEHRRLEPSVLNLRSPAPALKTFVEESRRLSLAPGGGIPGRAWQQRAAVWMADLAAEPDLRRREAAFRAELHTGLAFPVQNAGDFFGVLEFFTLRNQESDQSIINMMNAIGSRIGQFIQRRAAEDGLRRAYEDLEIRVQQRTTELKTANESLRFAISERKRLESELLEITEKERRRIGLDLHDDLGQKLSGIAMMTKGLELQLAKKQAAGAEDAARIHQLVQEAMTHASGLARDMATLDTEEKDLEEALRGLAAFARDSCQTDCHFKLQGKLPALDPAAVKQLYKIAQEAVTNAVKHGKARTIALRLSGTPEQLTLTVRNDGLPFPDLKEHRSAGMGLRIMSYRAGLLNGVFEVKGLPSGGTLVTCTVPLSA